jgi:maltooligosyltrehalose trehalohydrolase
VRFEVWAPHATESVTLLLRDERHDMSQAAGGWWEADVDSAPGDRYEYSLDGGEPRSDPRAVRLPDGPEAPAAVFDLDSFDWTDDMWRGPSLPGAIVYELHVGTFTGEGTLDAAIDRLDHLVDLGVDLVEVMPLATLPGRHGWGYDGVGLYAVHEPYGGPAAFARFVDACHARGMGVCLDVVYNHLGPSGNHLSEFGPYFSDRYGTPWGAALNLDDADSDEVRRFVIDNALMWLRDFHVDGLRLDAVHALYDDRAITLLEELSAEVNALGSRLGRQLWLIAESDRNDPLTVMPREGGGLGMQAQWADDVHHGLHALLTGEDQGYYADFGAPDALAKVLEGVFLHDGTYSTFRRRTHGRPVDRTRTPGWRFVVSLETHDQVGNRALGDRLSSQVTPGLIACGAALLLTSAATPMLFMGEEWGASTPWQYFTDHTDDSVAEAVRRGRRDEFESHGWLRGDIPDPQAEQTFVHSKLDWAERSQEPHASLLDWYTRLIRARREHPDLGDPRLDRVRVEHDADAQTVVVHRGAYVVVVNLSDTDRRIDLVLEVPGEIVLASRPGEIVLGWQPGEVVLAWQPGDTTLADGVLTLPPESAVIVGPALP